MPANLLSRKLSKTIKIFILTLFLTAVVFLSFLLLEKIFVIKKIDISGVEDKKKLNGLDIYYQQNLIFLSEKNIEKNLLAHNPLIESVIVKKIYPQTLLLNIQLNKIQAIMETNTGYIYLSEDGKIISKTKEMISNIPLIHYYQKINHDSVSPGDQISYKDVLVTLFLLKKTSEFGIIPDTIDIKGFDMLVFNIGERKLYFTSEKNKEIQGYEFEQIVKQFKIEGREFKSLDLRFEKPIIKF